MRLAMTLFFLGVTQLSAQTVQLATRYEDQDVRQFLVSEKLDGIRAIWNGKALSSRQGHPIQAPTWFTEGWPDIWLDGELWAGRERFNDVQTTVLDEEPHNQAWRSIRYMVFDAPDFYLTFEERYKHYLSLVEQTNHPYLQAIEQIEIEDSVQLMEHLDNVIKGGGEGLILHRKDAYLKDGRSDALLKLKRFKDAEALVIGYVAGKGKYTDKLGALRVELANGRRFKIGTGFTDLDRAQPPKIGEYITFRYQGLTATGLPRFASFLRVRKGEFEFREPD